MLQSGEFVVRWAADGKHDLEDEQLDVNEDGNFEDTDRDEDVVTSPRRRLGLAEGGFGSENVRFGPSFIH